MTNSEAMEKKSSAVTLSDMEMFIFPELIYSLVLANIMSPRIWRWLEDSWFSGMERLSPYRRVLRLKQYIMDNYAFNLDLDTWGLTTKERELNRFKAFISEDTLRQSNALFGYEGDKYYFDIDIRTHFGLDKYEGNVIPYWKTETVEAMDAFRHKPYYSTGAGECVSLAALYAAALFVIAKIPLKDIYLMATPLHSQNFIDIDDGILTNNRRLVTKNMWFNGTALSAQARRALENERVTIVAHETGCIHTIYEEANIDKDVYRSFSDRLERFLETSITDTIIGNFLRHDRDIQKCFQLRWPLRGVDYYIKAERIFSYEHGSPYRVNDNTLGKLMDEIDTAEFKPNKMPKRITLNDLQDYTRKHRINMKDPEDVKRLKELFASECMDAQESIEKLARFCCVDPKLPDIESKNFVRDEKPLGIDLDMGREEIMDRLEHIRAENDAAAMAFYAYRDLNRTETEPFVLAATQRNPVSIKGTEGLSTKAVLEQIKKMPDDSIYDEPGRLAQPDEVWNYGRGDGAEKALLLANILKNRMSGTNIFIDISPNMTTVKANNVSYSFPSQKELRDQRWEISP
ncbi:MAG: hypothetical protein JXB42_02630 [Deltaproteobacteria bacterium]|nr:hypothetical protein [Deltaproteobacteria bacterium]